MARPSGIAGLDLILAGPEIPNPAELLASPRLAEALAEARASYDFVIIDSAPLLAVTDSTILGAVADGVVLVTRGDNMKRGEAERLREVLDGLGTTLLGVLVNAVSRRPDGYGYGYGYGYGSDREAEPAPAGARALGIVDRADSPPDGTHAGHSASNGSAR